MNVGVVCEGVNDFIALREIISAYAIRAGRTLGRFDAIQPEVDATSRQKNGGGWRRVQLWLAKNSGNALELVFNPGLFSCSPSYDILIIHLDGDVYNLDPSITPVQRARCFQNPLAIARLIESRIDALLNPPGDLDDKIVYAVPVMHMESWLLAATVRKPLRRNVELLRIKDRAIRYLSYRYPNEDRSGLVSAAQELGAKIELLRAIFGSLDHFASKLDLVI